MTRPALLVLLAGMALGLFACTTTHQVAIEPVEVVQAQVEIPETQLLDVGIQTFEPGLNKDEIELVKEGVFPAVRKAEAVVTDPDAALFKRVVYGIWTMAI